MEDIFPLLERQDLGLQFDQLICWSIKGKTDISHQVIINVVIYNSLNAW